MLNSICAVPGLVCAVGDHGEIWCALGADPRMRNRWWLPPVHLHAVHCLRADLVLAVGTEGTVALWAGRRWELLPGIPGSPDLTTVLLTEEGEALAGDVTGALWRLALEGGAHHQLAELPGAITALCQAPCSAAQGWEVPGDLYAAAGAELRRLYDERGLRLPGPAFFLASQGSTGVVAVGEAGAYLVRPGLGVVEDLQAPKEARGAAALPGGGLLVAVGEAGALWRWSPGEAWTPIHVGGAQGPVAVLEGRAWFTGAEGLEAAELAELGAAR